MFFIFHPNTTCTKLSVNVLVIMVFRPLQSLSFVDYSTLIIYKCLTFLCSFLDCFLLMNLQFFHAFSHLIRQLCFCVFFYHFQFLTLFIVFHAQVHHFRLYLFLPMQHPGCLQKGFSFLYSVIFLLWPYFLGACFYIS